MLTFLQTNLQTSGITRFYQRGQTEAKLRIQRHKELLFFTRRYNTPVSFNQMAGFHLATTAIGYIPCQTHYNQQQTLYLSYPEGFGLLIVLCQPVSHDYPSLYSLASLSPCSSYGRASSSSVSATQFFHLYFTSNTLEMDDSLISQYLSWSGLSWHTAQASQSYL